ncbi:MAG: preprotein translocase subunit SecG [Candidatus Wallbacteria bacterium]|nr:preprotein translocase subunit SecG [Candidatus Wallbacteria bacterium]
MGALINILIIVHVLVSIALIAVVLFQADKGEGLSGAFGGGASYAVFGDRGPEPFLAKLTIIAAVVFMITSISLAYLTSVKRNPEAALLNRPAREMPANIPDTGI